MFTSAWVPASRSATLSVYCAAADTTAADADDAVCSWLRCLPAVHRSMHACKSGLGPPAKHICRRDAERLALTFRYCSVVFQDPCNGNGICSLASGAGGLETACECAAGYTGCASQPVVTLSTHGFIMTGFLSCFASLASVRCGACAGGHVGYETGCKVVMAELTLATAIEDIGYYGTAGVFWSPCFAVL